MVFSSTTFLLAFLPLVAILYYICPRKLRNGLLLVFSLLFYGWGEPKYILIMLFSTVFDYCNGLAIGWFRRRQREKGAKGVLILSVVGNLAILGFFKYTDFAINNINGLLGTAIPALGLLLPIGISFYTFQTMSYTIDVYRGLVPAQRNIIDFGAYVTLFPQLIAGPIVQYKTVAYDLEHRRENLAEASEGLQRLVIGLGKKVLIANQMGAIWEEIAAMSDPTAATAWLGAIAYTFQIYFDFSGYSDMAIGPLRVPLRHRILAAVAHQPVHMVPGVRLHPAGRQPQGQGAAAGQHRHRLAADRPVARRQLELRPVGRVLRRAAAAGKDVPAEVAG